MESTLLMSALLGLGMAGLYFGIWAYDGIWRSWAGSAWGRHCPHLGIGILWAGAGLTMASFAFAMDELFESPGTARAAFAVCAVGGTGVVLVSVVLGLTRFPRFMVPAWLRAYLDGK
ncbi:hypothetical protein [Arthrobacter sp. KK5.5]|uniref:hypothetical protein n=1 Tax=Arthrobacter sp. KK5.5 TaxID=3373084 RepID=UPI003EE42F93